MIKIEVTNCRQCILRSYLKNLDSQICLGTRIGVNVGSPETLPTIIPDEFVPNAVKSGEQVPDSPVWCPLRHNCLVLGFQGTIPDEVGEIPNLWPEDIGK